jgi:hypothetical protein
MSALPSLDGSYRPVHFDDERRTDLTGKSIERFQIAASKEQRCCGDFGQTGRFTHNCDGPDVSAAGLTRARIVEVVNFTIPAPPVATVRAGSRDAAPVHSRLGNVDVGVGWMLNADEPAMPGRTVSPDPQIAASRDAPAGPIRQHLRQHISL